MQMAGQGERVEISNCRENAVGSWFKGSKVEYIYEFKAKHSLHTLKLVRSKFSNRIRIFLDENLIHAEEGQTLVNFSVIGNNFRFVCPLNDFRIEVNQDGEDRFGLEVYQTGTRSPIASGCMLQSHYISKESEDSGSSNQNARQSGVQVQNVLLNIERHESITAGNAPKDRPIRVSSPGPGPGFLQVKSSAGLDVKSQVSFGFPSTGPIMASWKQSAGINLPSQPSQNQHMASQNTAPRRTVMLSPQQTPRLKEHNIESSSNVRMFSPQPTNPRLANGPLRESSKISFPAQQYPQSRVPNSRPPVLLKQNSDSILSENCILFYDTGCHQQQTGNTMQARRR